MGMALAAEADDGDLLVLDQIEIGIPIVINAHCHIPSVAPAFYPLRNRVQLSRLHMSHAGIGYAAAAADGGDAGAGDIDQAQRPHQRR